MARSLKPSVTNSCMSCVILESKLKEGEHDLETKDSTEVVEWDLVAVNRDEDIHYSLSESSEDHVTTFTSGTSGESDVQSFLNRF